MERNYILATPAKNEEVNLPKLIKTVLAQEIKPVVWVIVDDGSTDSTGNIIDELCKAHSWVKKEVLGKAKRDLNQRYAFVCKHGFETGMKYCETNGIPYSYIALVDADIQLDADYFKNLITELERDDKLGIVSGGVYMEDANGKLHYREFPIDHPIGAARMWRKKCFDETKGYEVIKIPDTISNVRAMMSGWKTRQFPQYKAQHARESNAVGGLMRGTYKKGKTAHFVGQPFWFVVGKSAKMITRKPRYLGIPYFFGYLSALVTMEKRIDDENVLKYFREVRPKQARKDMLSRKNKKKNAETAHAQ